MAPFHVSKADFPEGSLEIIRASHAALNQQDKLAVKSWELWKAVGAGLVEVRRLAMSRSMSNSAFGRGYTAAHAPILAASKLDLRIKDSGDRTRLVALMDNLPAVENWLEGLSPEDRRRWTHPSTIYKQWQASLRAPKNYEGKVAPAVAKQVQQDAMVDTLDSLRKENTQLKVAAQHRCDVDLMQSDVEAIGNWLRMGVLPQHKLSRLRDILLEICPLPLPKVPVTHPDASDQDDVGLH